MQAAHKTISLAPSDGVRVGVRILRNGCSHLDPPNRSADSHVREFVCRGLRGQSCPRSGQRFRGSFDLQHWTRIGTMNRKHSTLNTEGMAPIFTLGGSVLNVECFFSAGSWKGEFSFRIGSVLVLEKASPSHEPKAGGTCTSPRPSPHRLRRLRRRGEGETLAASRRCESAREFRGSKREMLRFGEFSPRPSPAGTGRTVLQSQSQTCGWIDEYGWQTDGDEPGCPLSPRERPG